MVLEPNTERCVNEEVELRRRVDKRKCANKDAGLEGGGLEGPTSIGEGNECQRGRWAPKGGGL